jgi:hypothetical protein
MSSGAKAEPCGRLGHEPEGLSLAQEAQLPARDDERSNP